jgi:hypothetical protein
MTWPTDTQLPFVRPGYCIKGCGTRLSAANTSGVCDTCTDLALADAQAKRRRVSTIVRKPEVSR